MTSAFRVPDDRRSQRWAAGRLPARHRLTVAAGLCAYSLIAISALAPAAPVRADELGAYIAANAQSIAVDEPEVTLDGERDSYAATPGVQTLVAGGTNRDWAKLVLLFGGWPITDTNVTVILRWMRQENGTDSWWNRNNPLNNGFGSGGGGGLGRYADLVVAAHKVAENLLRHPGFAPIVEGFAASAPTEVIESSIWNSPWASGHYADGAHWHYTDVPVVRAPAGAW